MNLFKKLDGIECRRVESNNMKMNNNKALRNLILKWSKRICSSLKEEGRRKRGRLSAYKDHLIVAALLLKESS